jgi:uncharacterized protein YwqG
MPTKTSKPKSVLAPFETKDAAKLKKHIRTAWFPKAKKGTGRGPTTRIGGTPWLPKGVDWPVCPNCKKHMALLLQLDLEDLPKGAPSYGKGLAQLFYCLNTQPQCEVDCQAFFPYAKSVVARVVSKKGPGQDAAPVDVPGPVTPKLITGWTIQEDLPNLEELEELGLEIDFESELGETYEGAKVPRSGDKLGGWPFWVQSIEYPKCRACKKTMRLLFQIDSNDVVGPQWGDMGCAHLTQCPTHKDRLAFGWACG